MPTLVEVRVPPLGGAHDVPLIERLVALSDRVSADQGIASLESDKATMEVPTPVAGIVREWRAAIGDVLSEGDLIALIEPDDGRAEVAAIAEDSRVVDERHVSPRVHADTTLETEPEPAASSGKVFATSQLEAIDSAIPVHASPGVRRFARDLGLKLAEVKGSGRNGRIVRADVESYVRKAADAPPKNVEPVFQEAATTGLAPSPWPVVDFARFGAIEQRALDRDRTLSMAKLTRNWALVPQVTQHDTADITDLDVLRDQLDRDMKEEGSRVFLLAFLVKACASLLKRFPDVNASLGSDGTSLILKKYCHIGFVVETPQGARLPVLRDVDAKGVGELALEAASLAAKARGGTLQAGETEGGCFSIHLLGDSGGTAFTPIVNAPEVAILGVSRPSPQPVWNGDAFLPRLLLPLSFSYDHRVVDGASAARFTTQLARLLGDFRRVLL